MKPVLPFLLLLSGLYKTSFAETTYKLAEAEQKKLVLLSITGAVPDTAYHGEYSSHYGPCMALQVANTTNQALNLNLEYGYKLEPQDSSLQTMIVTQTLLVKLQPRQKKDYRVFAMCSQAHDKGPSKDESFVLRTRASGNLLGVTELINRKKYQSDAAQNAVWCLTDNYELSSITSEDTTMMYALRRFVARAKGILPEKIYTPVYPPAAYIEPEPVRTMHTVYSGSLSYSFSKTAKVTIALFDEAGRLKKTYVNNETQNSGEHSFNYKISSEEMDNKRHYLRIIRDGKLEEEISIIPRD